MVNIVSIIVILSGIVLGLFIAQYAAYILKKNEKLASKYTICIALVHTLMYGLVYIIYGLSITGALYLLLTTALLGLSIVDWCSYEIPIQFNYFILGLGIIRVVTDSNHWLGYIIGMLLVSGIFFVIVLATNGKGMGGGDVKLMFTVGLLLGWKKILLVMLLGSVLGSIIHIIIMKVHNKDKMLAFGPYLSLGAYLTVCYGDKIINWYMSYIRNIAR